MDGKQGALRGAQSSCALGQSIALNATCIASCETMSAGGGVKMQHKLKQAAASLQAVLTPSRMLRPAMQASSSHPPPAPGGACSICKQRQDRQQLRASHCLRLH